MVEPDRAGILHRRAQQLAERFAVGRDQRGGIDARQSPALPLGVERVRWRADLDARQVDVLVAPGVEAVRTHADRHVEIEPDRQSGVLREVAAGGQLLVGDPLQEFDEGKLLRIGCAQCGEPLRRRLPPFERPLPPRLLETPAQHLEGGVRFEPVASLLPERGELLSALVGAILAKVFVGERERRHLDARDIRVVDELLFAERFDLALELPARRLRKLGDRLDVDIKRIEEVPAVRIVRTGFVGPVVEQRMQRIEPDRGRAERSGHLDQVREVAEIAVPPIVARADAVKLDRDGP